MPRSESGPDLTNSERAALYAARRFIGSDLEEKLGLRIPFDDFHCRARPSACSSPG